MHFELPVEKRIGASLSPLSIALSNYFAARGECRPAACRDHLGGQAHVYGGRGGDSPRARPDGAGAATPPALAPRLGARTVSSRRKGGWRYKALALGLLPTRTPTARALICPEQVFVCVFIQCLSIC